MRYRWLILLPLLAGLLLLVDRRSSDRPRHVAERLRADDLFLRAVRAGQGDTTVLLIHGYAESLMAYRPIFDRLASRSKVVAVDMPGFGLSDKPESGYTLEDYVRRMSDFIDRHIEGPVVLVGHSMGGEVAAAVAIEKPDRVVGLVLIASAGWGLSETYHTLIGQGRGVLGWINAAAGELVIPLYDSNWLSQPDEWSTYDPLLDPSYRAASSEVLRQFDFAALRNRFSEISQPTMLIWGQRDPTTPFEFGLEMERAIPCSEMFTVTRTLHRPHQTEPDSVLSAIRKFLVSPPVCNEPGQSEEEQK